MIKADVVVVGAGPGGCVAAQRLAERGVKVILIEEKQLPRLKTCGDLVTREGLDVLQRSGLQDWADRFKQVNRLRFVSPDAQVLEVPLGMAPLARMIPRRHLDFLLAQEAIRSGTRLMDGTRVRRAAMSAHGWQVTAGRDEVEAQVLVLADGSHAPLTRSLGLLRGRVDLIAVRQYLAGDIDPDGPLEFHFQPNIIPGYTWMFPLGDGQINVGAGTYFQRTHSGEVDLRAVVEAFKAIHPLDAGRLAGMQPAGPVRGHPLHTDLSATQTHGERVLVVGDAAGLVGPFTGEGIAAAMRSAERAADSVWNALCAGDFSAKVFAPYTQALRQRYLADQKAARTLRSLLRLPALLNRFIRNLREDEIMARLFAEIYLDERSPRLLLKPGNILRSMF